MKPHTPPKGFESLDARNKLGTNLRLMIDDYNSSMSGRLSSWKETQDVYDEQVILSSLVFLDELKPYHMSLLKPRADALNAAVVDPIAGSDPYFTVTSRGLNPDQTGAIQQTLHYALEQAGFDYKLRHMGFMATMRGRGPFRLRFETMTDELLADSDIVDSMANAMPEVDASEEGQVQLPMNEQVRYSGLVIDTIPAENMVIFPTYVEQIPKAVMVGHWSWQRASDVLQKQLAGRYFQDILIPEVQDSTANVPNTIPTPVVSDPSNYPLLIYDLLVRVIPEQYQGNPNVPGTEKWYRVSLLYNFQMVIDMEEYKLPTPWYFAPALRYEPLSFWPRRSIAESLMPHQTIYNDAWTLMIAGAASGSFSSAAVTGWTGESENIRIQLGSLTTLPQGAQVFPLPTRFMPESAQFMIDRIPTEADGLCRISQAANAQDFAPSTTATAVNAVMAGQTAGISEFMQTFGLELERSADFARFLLAANWEAFKAFHGDAVMCEVAEDMEGRCVISVNGKNSAGNAQVLMQKIQLFVQTMQQLGVALVPADQALSAEEIARMVLNILDFPNDTRRLLVAPQHQPPPDQMMTGGQPAPQGGQPGAAANAQQVTPDEAAKFIALLQAVIGTAQGLPQGVPGGQNPQPAGPIGVALPGPGIPQVPNIPAPGPNPGIPTSTLGL